MPVTFKRQDDLEKMLEEFASFEALETIELPNDPDPIPDKKDAKE
ncbi:SPJ_0845 family protein [Streptococcus sp. DD13]|nr:SPJ_0845 family protein [Streptococcus sp. DD13]KXT79186.1 hypothetical protein STRDD13_00117 [Streptococcus sp. DD13]